MDDLWSSSQLGGRFGLILLTFINLFNYIDRYLPSAVKDLIKNELQLTDAQTAAPLTMFIIVYMLASPVFGYLADHNWSRRKLIAFGIFVWSFATAFTAFSNSYGMYLFSRMIVGIGEAAYGTISPAIIADYFPIEKRSKALSIFYIAVPVGSAIGFAVGGIIGSTYGWRAAFAICGLPGLLLAFLALYITDPEKGASDSSSNNGYLIKNKVSFSDNEDMESPPPSIMQRSTDINLAESDIELAQLESASIDKNSPVIEIRVLSWMETLDMLRKDEDYVHVVLGLILTTFAIGGMADWLPAYMVRVVGWTENEASLIIGAMTVVGGLFGTLCGSYLNNLAIASEVIPNPEFFVMFSTLLISTLFAFLSMYTPNLTSGSATALLFMTQFFMWMYTGPANSLITNVPIQIRVRAFAVLILLQHAFGDAISPVIVGALSDSTGSLKSAVLILPIMLVLGAFTWMRGYFIIADSNWQIRNPNLTPASAIWNIFVRCYKKFIVIQE